MIKIIGAKGFIQDIDDFLKKTDEFAKENKLKIQVFNSDIIFGKIHLISAIEHAKRAINQKTNSTNSFEWKYFFMHQVKDN